MAVANKLDSNITGARIAEETAVIKTLPASPVWVPLEPNSYDSFGGQITTVARNPINASRQRQKGVTVDLDASGGINQDVTQTNLQDLLQGFVFANVRRKAETAGRTSPIDTFAAVPVIDVSATNDRYTLSNRELTAAVVNAGGTGYTVGDVLGITETGGTFSTSVVLTVATVSGGVVTGLTITNSGRGSVDPTTTTGNTLTGGSGTGATANLTFAPVLTFRAGDLIFGADFGDASNDGLKSVASVDGTGTQVNVNEDLTVDEASPPAVANLTVVGFQFGANELAVNAAGSLPILNRNSGTKDFTQFGLVPGEWIFVGGDTGGAAGNQFPTNAGNNNFVRVQSISATQLVLDKTQNTMVTEVTSGGETIQLFFGRVLKNESDPGLILRRTYQIERTLGSPDDALPSNTQAEYLVGAVANQLTLTFNTADKVLADLAYIATDNEQRTQATGLKSGTRPALVSEDAFNTSNDFTRLKMSLLDPANSNPTALFAFLTEFSVVINNNASPNKAVSVLGAFDVTVGQFNVDGSANAYFSQIEAVAAVRNNSDVTLDFILAKANKGIAVDIPLIALGDGRLNVEQDQSITLPLETGAAADRIFNHTILFTFYDYLPSAADPS